MKGIKMQEQGIHMIQKDGTAVPLLAEDEAFPGVSRIADKVILDVEKVTGKRPAHLKSAEEWKSGPVILAATLGRSPLTERLVEEGRIPREHIQALSGRSECYLRLYLPGRSASAAVVGEAAGAATVENIHEGEPDIFLILGSDKRGTIYGLFSLSEALGVSPLTDWGDVPAGQQENFLLDETLNCISREPSVRYRGFFINDEWPAFGTWCTEHFGGFNASMYDSVFELLLRLRGNYLWPAMWTSSFPLDGPGPADMELADEYGIIWSFSHHEPCLRASEEWDQVRGEHSVYGNAWDFRTNREGLLRYWQDALKDRGRYENMITIGMRGERDSALLGEDSPAADNIELLKEIISAQRKLIRDGKDGGSIRPETREMLAVYKEVEGYYYGADAAEGLYTWEGLDGVICMLSDDNFGHLRALPDEAMRRHRGGYGMYYHLDYHGGPVSYEWVDSTPFSQIWEQMCEAYEHGVQELWIVNVGDLKFHEVTLRYFMDLAYDYEKWGRNNPGSYLEYPRMTAKELLASCKELLKSAGEQAAPCNERPLSGNEVSGTELLEEEIAYVLEEYIQLASLRRPESLHPEIFHPCHALETDRLLQRVERLAASNERILHRLKGTPAWNGYYSMIGWPCMAVVNLLQLHLYAGKNHHYAAQGRPSANIYAELTERCLARDASLAGEWAAFLGGKWKGMELAHHIGFTKWNDFGRQNPVIMRIQPQDAPILSVSRADTEQTFVRDYDGPGQIVAEDFCYAGNDSFYLELSNNGEGDLRYRTSAVSEDTLMDAKDTEHAVKSSPAGSTKRFAADGVSWLQITPAEGVLQTGELCRMKVSLKRECLPAAAAACTLTIEGSDETKTQVRILAKSEETAYQGVGRQGILTLRPEDFESESWKLLPYYGKHGSGLKAPAEENKKASCHIHLPKEGEYILEFHMAPLNPTGFEKPQTLGLKTEGNALTEITVARASRTIGFCSNEDWSRAVLDQERVVRTALPLKAGEQRLELLSREEGVILEELIIYPEKAVPDTCYLGWEAE